MEYEVGVKYKLKPKPRQPDVNDAVYRLEDLLSLYPEDTTPHQVITSAIKEIKDLRYCMGELDDIIDRLQIRIEKLEQEIGELR